MAASYRSATSSPLSDPSFDLDTINGGLDSGSEESETESEASEEYHPSEVSDDSETEGGGPDNDDNEHAWVRHGRDAGDEDPDGERLPQAHANQKHTS